MGGRKRKTKTKRIKALQVQPPAPGPPSVPHDVAVRAADANWSAARAGWTAAAVAILSLLVTLFSISYQRDASLMSISAEREATQRTHRPWLTFDEQLTLKEPIVCETSTKFFDGLIEGSTRNVGQAPAKEVTAWVTSVVMVFETMKGGARLSDSSDALRRINAECTETPVRERGGVVQRFGIQLSPGESHRFRGGSGISWFIPDKPQELRLMALACAEYRDEDHLPHKTCELHEFSKPLICDRSTKNTGTFSVYGIGSCRT